MNILKRIKWSLMTNESICKEFIGKTISIEKCNGGVKKC